MRVMNKILSLCMMMSCTSCIFQQQQQQVHVEYYNPQTEAIYLETTCTQMQSLDVDNPALAKLYDVAKHGTAEERYDAYELLLDTWGFRDKWKDEGDIKEGGCLFTLSTNPYPCGPEKGKTIEIMLDKKHSKEALSEQRARNFTNGKWQMPYYWTNQKNLSIKWTNTLLKQKKETRKQNLKQELRKKRERHKFELEAQQWSQALKAAQEKSKKETHDSAE